jgi:hypothetical protein
MTVQQKSLCTAEHAKLLQSVLEECDDVNKWSLQMPWLLKQAFKNPLVYFVSFVVKGIVKRSLYARQVF